MAEDDDDSKRDYEVGYGKPPKHTQFKPGQSGNPSGRPKGSKNLKTDLQEELSEKVPIREGDRSRLVSKQRAYVKTIVANALKGDARPANLLASLMLKLLDTGEDDSADNERLQDEELEIIRAFEARVRARNSKQDVDRDASNEPGDDGE